MIKSKIGGVYIAALCIVTLFLSSISCTKNLQKESTVYKNDFDDNNISKINNIKQDKFRGSGVLGRYGNDGFELALEKLPSHDLVRISFDLYIHNNWRGNSQLGITDSSDIWIMDIDRSSDLYTTFSNNICGSPDCSYQSYPSGFPFQNNPPLSNAIKTGLPGIGGKATTTMYKIVRTAYHNSSEFKLGCYAQLFRHKNSPDPLADASWSVDNLTIKVIKFRE